MSIKSVLGINGDQTNHLGGNDTLYNIDTHA